MRTAESLEPIIRAQKAAMKRLQDRVKKLSEEREELFWIAVLQDKDIPKHYLEEFL